MAEEAAQAEDQDAIPFEVNKNVLSGAEIKKSFVPDKNPESKSPWTSLEVAKIVVGAMTPLLIAYLGFYVTNQTRDADRARAVVDDLRARKAAAEPLIVAIQDNTIQSINALEGLQYDMGRFKGNKRGEAIDQDTEKFNELMRSGESSFSRLRSSITDDEVYTALRTAYADSDRQPLRGANLCLHGDHKKSECLSFETEGQVIFCNTLLTEVLFNFERLPIKGDTELAQECGLKRFVHK